MSINKLPALPPRPPAVTLGCPYESWTAEAYMDAADARIAELTATAELVPYLERLAKKRANRIAELEQEIREVRKQFDGAISEIVANKTISPKDDYNRGWNAGSDNAVKFIHKYIRGEGLFQ